MFDIYSTTYTASSYPQEVHEHRAPTDDSIRLATELREKILQQIIYELTPTTNILQGVSIVIKTGLELLTLCVNFNINGQDYTASALIPNNRLLETQQKAFHKLAQEISNFITSLILPEIAENISNLLKRNQ